MSVLPAQLRDCSAGSGILKVVHLAVAVVSARSEVSLGLPRLGHAIRLACVISLSLSACSNVPAVQVTELQGQLQERDKMIASLRRELNTEKAYTAALLKARDELFDASRLSSKATTRPATKPATQQVSMCFKDYCPCDQPQEGMDSILCDQLEAGLEVSIESMIAGRGGREARRQMAEMGY